MKFFQKLKAVFMPQSAKYLQQLVNAQNSLSDKMDIVIERQSAENTDFITIRQASNLCGKKPDTIRKRLRDTSRPPISHFISGKYIYIHKDFLKTW